jgi:DNA helicase HerA-like ATPase
MAEDTIFIGRSGKEEVLYLPMANRHGLITGATGTGKTVSLQILAEGFSSKGVPVFAADIKGDLSGVAMKGEPKDFLLERARKIGWDDYGFVASPVIFWDLFGKQGHAVRTTMTEMGPVLLSRLMGLSEAQEGALNIAFKLADEEGLAILDLKDLRALLSNLAERGKDIRTDYGNVAAATVGTIQRRLVVLEEQGAENFFGEPALKIEDLMRSTADGRGYINILAADKLMGAPQLYATFLLWLLSELFEDLPEVGDPDRPKLVFFFDEAHLLFSDAPPGLVQKIEQVVKLVRSKGVGVYFVTQNPMDIPNAVLAQLGNRIQHALRAYTPREQKAVKTAAETFRPNPAFDTEKTITELGVGEALVSVLDPKGVPTMVERTLVRPPMSRLGPIEEEERAKIVKGSPVYGLYDQAVDRDSAYELLADRAEAAAERREASRAGRKAPEMPRQRSRPAPARTRDTATERFVKNMAGSVGREVGNMIVRQVFRGILGGLSRR